MMKYLRLIFNRDRAIVSDDEAGENIERSKKVEVIEIERLIEPIEDAAWTSRKTQLMAMSFDDLCKLAHEIQGCTPHEAMDLIDAWIAEDNDDRIVSDQQSP